MKTYSILHSLFFIVGFLSCTSLSAQCNCNPAENQAAILEIERIMDVENWDTLQPMNNWEGLTWNSAGCLESLTFRNSQRNGKILDLIFKKLTCLVELNLFGAYKVFENIPASIKNMQQLKILNLAGSGIIGRIPPELGALSQLEILDVSSTNLLGTIPAEIGRLVNLKELFISGNLNSGSIPSEIGNLINLKTLWISDNRMGGPIPPEIGNLTNLEDILIGGGGTTFSSAIPDEIGNLRSLKFLFIGISKFTGAIPATIQKLKNLESCYLDTNELTGEIGTAFQNLPKLKYLNLSYNKLSGTIPDYLADLPELGTLILNVNQFTGTVPDFSRAPKLTALHLSYNYLDSIPPITRAAGSNFSITMPSNFLTFDDLLPNLKYEIYKEQTQRPFFPDTTLLFAPCAVPSIYLNIDAGINDNVYTWFKGEEVIYVTNRNEFHFDSVFQNSSQFPGSYTCQVSNPAAKVVLQSGTITIAFSDEIDYQPDTIVVRDTLCFGKRLEIAANTWADCYSRDTVLHFTSPFTGCDSIIRVQLTCTPCGTTENIPTIFTPNNDAWNETFEIPMIATNLAKYGNNELLIYDRYKQLVYRKKDYRNEWNGTNEYGNPLPVGTYYYVFRYADNEHKQGIVTIIR